MTKAFHQPAGGTAELAGTSRTTTVSVVELGPLTAGVTYEFWLVGRNSQRRRTAEQSCHACRGVMVRDQWCFWRYESGFGWNWMSSLN